MIQTSLMKDMFLLFPRHRHWPETAVAAAAAVTVVALQAIPLMEVIERVSRVVGEDILPQLKIFELRILACLPLLPLAGVHPGNSHTMSIF
jgi:hypothetical protein